MDSVKLLVHKYHEVCLLSEKFNEDPLEEHFGQHRARGVENNNLENVDFSIWYFVD